jgi:hypothetical protein
MAISRFKTSTLAQGLPKYQDVWDGTTTIVPTTGFVSLATTTVGAGGASTITFSSIPQVFKHLQIRHVARTTNASTNGNMYIQLNGDTGSNYVWHRLEGYGTGVGAVGITGSAAFAIGGLMTGSQSIASSYGAGILDITDYSSTIKNKTMRTLTGYENNGNGSAGNDQGYINSNSGLWLSTSAINSISITINGGGNFAQYSQFALYGIQG